MCGLVAMLGLDGRTPDAGQLQRMAAVIGHRGPDDEGLHVEGPVGFGFRRLSILDLSSTGHQPMRSDDGLVTIVFNGEIYNYVELREELVGLGFQFRSSGDTEVLLNAYRAWGTNCLDRLNGMWAFVIDDRRRGVLFGSRDRFGIKPLFRWQNAGAAIFASEIKSIRASGLYETRGNPSTVASFLAESRLDETAETFYAEILSVRPAHAFEIDYSGRYREWRYWKIPAAAEEAYPDPAKAFAELFEDCINVHMRSDVPVAVHLSGGLDSTSIACASARIRRQAGAAAPLWAFCYADARFDETRYVDATIAQTGARRISLQTSPVGLWDSLPRTLWHQDEPVHSMTALVGYRLMELTAQTSTKVILNGQGADETIGGYPSYFREYWRTLLGTRSMLHTYREIASYSAAHPGSPVMRSLDLLRHVVQGGLRRSSRYRTLSYRRWRDRIASQDWLSPGVRDAVPYDPPQAAGLDEVLRHSVNIEPLPLYLRVEDRNASAHSVEARVPFLDHRLVSLVFALSPEWKLRGPWNKFVLREAMKGRIPEIVRTRPDKMGFPTAASAWFRDELYEPLKSLISDPSFRDLEFFDHARLARHLEEHRSGAADHADELFKAAQLYHWKRNLGEDLAAVPAAPVRSAASGNAPARSAPILSP